MLGVLFWFCGLFVFYVYIGYPVLIALLSVFKKDAVYDANYSPEVTLLIAAHNEEKIIAEKLKNSLALEYPRESLKILIADDGSTDKTAEIVRAFESQGVKLFSHPERMGKLATINEVMKTVQSEFVLLSDADNYYNPDTLREIVRPFSDSSVGAVSGGRGVIGDNALGNAEGIYWKYEEFIKRHESKVGSCVGVAGDALAIRKKLYTFPPDNVINDDFYIALSVITQGFRVVYAPKARSFHPVSDTEQGEVERRSRMVAGRYQSLLLANKLLPLNQPVVLWQIFSHKYLRPVVPVAMFGALVTSVLALYPHNTAFLPAWLALISPFNWIVFFIQIAFYSLSFIGMRYRFRGLLGRVLYIPTFLVNSNFAAIRGLYRYLTDHQSVKWERVSHSGRTIE